MIQVQRAMVGVSEQGTARYLAERFRRTHQLLVKRVPRTKPATRGLPGFQIVLLGMWSGLDAMTMRRSV